jgi:hypothetical protein
MSKKVDPIETAVQQVVRCGFVPGDVLTSAHWSAPLLLRSIDKDVIRVAWLMQIKSFEHPLRYLPPDTVKAAT